MRLFSALFLCACAALSSISFAQQVPVGLSPAYLWSHNDLHVLCLQVDRNFDGKQDAEDAVAAWWRVDAAETAHLVREFAWGEGYTLYPFGFPVRPAFSQSGDTVFLYLNNGVTAFDVTSGDSIGRLDVGAQVGGMYWQPDGTLFCSVRGQMYSLQAYTWETKTMLGEFDVVDFPQQIDIVSKGDEQWITVLSEGSWGAAGAVQFVNTSTFEMRSVEVDPLPNAILVADGSVYVVVNGLNQLWGIDPATAEVVRTIDVKEAAQPRDLTYHNGRLYVVSYDGGVGVYDAVSGEYIGSAFSHGRAESAAWHEGSLWVVNTYEPGSFTPGSTVEKLDLTSSIEITSSVNVEVYPNPSHDTFQLKFAQALTVNEIVQVYDVTGTLSLSFTVPAGATTHVVESDLLPGLYFILVGDAKLIHIVR